MQSTAKHAQSRERPENHWDNVRRMCRNVLNMTSYKVQKLHVLTEQMRDLRLQICRKLTWCFVVARHCNVYVLWWENFHNRAKHKQAKWQDCGVKCPGANSVTENHGEVRSSKLTNDLGSHKIWWKVRTHFHFWRDKTEQGKLPGGHPEKTNVTSILWKKMWKWSICLSGRFCILPKSQDSAGVLQKHISSLHYCTGLTVKLIWPQSNVLCCFGSFEGQGLQYHLLQSAVLQAFAREGMVQNFPRLLTCCDGRIPQASKGLCCD